LLDVNVLAEQLRTPEAALDFVRKRTALEPYSGLMKGSEATLASRGGNSLDRAMLLAALLRRRGLVPLIVHQQSSAESARVLLTEVAAAPTAARLLEDEVSRVLPHGSDIQTSYTEALAATRTEERQLADTAITALSGLADSTGSGDLATTQIAALRERYWVRVQKNGQAQDLDPSGLQEDTGLPVTVFAPGAIDPAVVQTVSLRIVADYVDNGSVRQSEVLHAEMASPDLWKMPLRLTILPATSQTPDGASFVARVALGDKTVGQGTLGVKDTGTPHGNPPAGPLGGVGIFGGALGGLGGGLGGAVANRSTPELGRVRIEFTFSDPNDHPNEVSRVLFDRILTAGGSPVIDTNVSDQIAAIMLLQMWDGVAALGATNPFTVAAATQEWLASYRVLRQAVASGTDETASAASSQPGMSPHILSLLLDSDLFGLDPDINGAKLFIYDDQPRLVFIRHGFLPRDWDDISSGLELREGVDIINSPIKFVGDAKPGRRTLTKWGVMDTALELNFTSADTGMNTYPILQAASDQGIQLVAIGPRHGSLIDGLKIPDALKSVLQTELASGHTALLVPASLVPVDQQRTFAWWKFDTETGYAIGKADLGGAQGMTEYSMLNNLISKYAKVAANLVGNIDRCYMGAIANALAGGGSGAIPVSMDRRIGQALARNAGVPAASDLPDINDSVALHRCIKNAACDALAQLAKIQVKGASRALGWQEAVSESAWIRQLLSKLTTKSAKAATNDVCQKW
jgi:hypothetical protein